MRAPGSTINDMAKAMNDSVKETATSGRLKTVFHKEKVSITGLTVNCTMENGKRDLSMGTAFGEA